jgi:putative Ca2+/H+ antiporter (TMEM165/GDT1 family)
MIPDKLDSDDTDFSANRYGIFATTVVVFFLAEMGDKTQVATIALAAQYSSLVAVVAGTTFGMMIANVPAVLVGDKVANKLPLNVVHGVAALIFAVLGILALLGVGQSILK